ncbi:MAG: hemolysin III family protein [Myxococcales bacterium]|nr:hemolysin III family protein [Myxococcales bacterium]MCB9524589.1 hemolysin III family protein [Myxococcales bacterium]
MATPNLSLAVAQGVRKVKPRLRGVSHQITFFVGLVGAAALVRLAPPGAATWAVGVYAASFLLLFGGSALYHRPTWSPRWRARLQRVDHAAIFGLIAGTYTPIAVLAVPPDVGQRLLLMVWLGAGAGMALSVLWVKVPKALMAALCVALGWIIVADWEAVRLGLGQPAAGLVVAGGALYTVGAVVYAARWPDPAPRVFGYHEVFHLFTIAAAGCHAVVVAGLL